MPRPLLVIDNLRIKFHVPHGTASVINGLHLKVPEMGLLGLVGESGSGKTVLAMSMLGHVRKPGRIESGSIIYKGVDLLSLSEDMLARSYCGTQLGLIAANARSHLNPLLRIGDQIGNVYMAHTGSGRREAREKALEILRQVGINDAERRIGSFPHELSGGMAQRVMIAITLVNAPNLIIADDCTNGLDVTVAAQVMDLFLQIMKTRRATGVLITHDLGLVAQCCDTVAIMYCGQIFETAPTASFFDAPRHPYSAMLLGSLPGKREATLQSGTTGTLPSPLNLPQGCLFHPRCSRADSVCRTQEPFEVTDESGRTVKCHHPILWGDSHLLSKSLAQGSINSGEAKCQR